MPARPEGSTKSLLRRGADYFEMRATAEFLAALLLFVVLVALLIANVLHRGFDSDEPQHLHVIWGWTRGLVQYRDLFDNHMPLFQIALAPIFAMIGERATILLWMRFILLPLFFVSLFCTYRIGARLFSPRVGIWSALCLGLYPEFHFTALQFRTDDLWSVFWLLFVVVLLSGELDWRRCLTGGLLLGFCFGVSMKSLLLFFSVLTAAALTMLLLQRERRNALSPHLFQRIASFLAGTALIPVTILIFFKGVWREFRYCVFDFNLLADVPARKHLVWLAVITFFIAVFVARQFIRASSKVALGARRALVALICGACFLFLEIFWRVITHQDYLPIYPLAFVIGTAGVLASSDALARHRLSTLRLLPLPALVALVEISALVIVQALAPTNAGQYIGLVHDVLALTTRNDYVLDCKGEAIFRPRPERFVFEGITMRAVAKGRLIDDAPERCVATGTCVAATILQQRFSRRTRQFVKQNYLPITKTLRVAGVLLKSSASNPSQSEFDVVIPSWYELISRNGDVSGLLDGVVYHGARFLSAGRHVFQSNRAVDNLALLWAQAADRHFTPFDRR